MVCLVWESCFGKFDYLGDALIGSLVIGMLITQCSNSYSLWSISEPNWWN